MIFIPVSNEFIQALADFNPQPVDHSTMRDDAIYKKVTREEAKQEISDYSANLLFYKNKLGGESTWNPTIKRLADFRTRRIAYLRSQFPDL